MKRPLLRIHNLETSEVIDREMNDEEFAVYEAERIAYEQREVNAQAQAAAKAALLERLGITEEEAKLLLG